MCDILSKRKKEFYKEDDKFFVSMSNITKRSLLPFIEGFSRSHTEIRSSIYSGLHPYANIYYAFGEDTNPFTRLKNLKKLILDSPENGVIQPHFPAPENPFTTRDPYSENEARNKYLQTQPVCFVVFGKPGLSSGKLAKLIAKSWNCVLISPEVQLKEEIEKNSEIGQYIAKTLKSERNVEQELILKLLEERISKNDVLHRGYVIEGLPLIPNDPNLDCSSYPEPASSPRNLDNKRKFTTCASSRFINSNSFLDFVDCIEEKGSKISNDTFDDTINPQKRFRECYDFDISRQIEDMFSIWALKPQIIVYVVCPDLDLINKMDEEIENRNFNELNTSNENSEENLVKRIIDISSNVNFQCEIYKCFALPVIDNIILKHNPQNVIRVDGRTSVGIMFEIVRMKLRILPLSRVIVPKKIEVSISFKIIGEGLTKENNQNVEGKTKEEVLKELSIRGAVSSKFKWRLSNWKFLCPVELAKGHKVEGGFKHVVGFMNCLYFLSSQEAEDSFIENPRPYLLPPNPKPSCKVAIIGPRYSGKTELSEKLAMLLGGTVIDVKRAEDELIDEQIHHKIVVAMRENLDNVIRDATEVLEKERYERERKRLTEKKSWSFKVKQLLDRLQILRNSQLNSLESSDEIQSIQHTLREYNIQFGENYEDLQVIRQDKFNVEAFAPDYLKIEEQPVPKLCEHDPEVTMMLEDRVKYLREIPIKLSSEDKVKMILRKIEVVPSTLIGDVSRDGGWILDNMYLDPEVWTGLIESGLEIDDIIVLFEESPYDYLIKTWRRLNNYDAGDYKEYNSDYGLSNIETGLNNLNEGDEDIYAKTEEVKTLLKFIKTLEVFEIDMKIFRDKLNELGKDVFFCNLKTMNAFESVFKHLYMQYSFFASKITDEAREIEKRDLEDLISEPIDDSDEEKEKENNQHKTAAFTEVQAINNLRLGDTSLYCPVALIRHGVFWKGRENLSVLFANKMYLLSNEKALDEFIRNPNDFSLPCKEPFYKIPPVRVCIVGPPGSGKSTMARAISNECGLAHIDFFNQIDEYMIQLGIDPVGWKHEDSLDIIDKESPREKTTDNLEDLGSENPKIDDLHFENQRFKSISSENNIVDKEAMRLIIRNYIKHGGLLPSAVLKETYLNYFKHPFDECGVVFDSFPNCSQDVESMLRKYAVPDLVIQLRCSLEEAEERLLPVLLESWNAEQDHKKQQEQKRYEVECLKFYERKEKWINERLKKLRRRNDYKFEGENNFDEFEDNFGAPQTPFPSLVTGNESEVLLITKDVTDIESEDGESGFEFDFSDSAANRIKLEKEFLEKYSKPKLFSDWEYEYTARERMSLRINEAYENTIQHLEKTRDRMKKESIPWFEINSSIGTKKLYLTLLKLLDPYLYRNSSVLELTYEVSMEVVEKLLDSGHYLPSSFGRYCPVQMYNRKIPFHMFLPMEAQGQVFPVLHRQYVYFLSGKEGLETFRIDPLKYLEQDSCSPLIAAHISIIGPPKCGKTTLAQRFARTYGFKIITRSEALQYTLKEFTWTDLALSIENNLRKGNNVSDELVARAVDLYSFDPRSESLGYILDGFPVNQLEAEELALLSIKPLIVIDLEADMDFCLECLKRDAEEIKKPSIFSPEFLVHQYKEWKLGAQQFREWQSGFAANIVKIDATRSKWGVWTRANEVISSRFAAIKEYFREADYDKVHHLEHMCISPYEYREWQSVYETFCPVCVRFGGFRSSSSPLDRRGVFQFHKNFYWICPEHVGTFIKDPLENLKAEMPTDRPQILEEVINVEHTCWAKRLKSGGYCLVTYVESFPYCKLVAGKPDIAILFKDCLYLFCTIECRNKFMERSSDYSDVEIHSQNTLPPIQVKPLPNLDFLEQTVASMIIKAVKYIGIIRPKLLGLSASTTAAIYLGAFLKTHNFTCDLDEVQIYKEVIKRMEARYKIFRLVIRNMKNKVNPFVSLIKNLDTASVNMNIHCPRFQ